MWPCEGEDPRLSCLEIGKKIAGPAPVLAGYSAELSDLCNDLEQLPGTDSQASA
jgi:hypothetical protein